MTANPDIRTGQCLCGAIKVSARLTSDVMACHCTQCQRWTGGGPLFSIDVEDISISGEENIGTHRASEWGERAFCKICGSTLYWKMQGQPISSIAPGLLDDQSGLSVSDEIFIDYRPCWISAWPKANQSTEAQEIAKFEAWNKENNA